MSLTIERPIPFRGTKDERIVNFITHRWISYDPEEPRECDECCARTYHAAAYYPCGTEPPRERKTYGAQTGSYNLGPPKILREARERYGVEPLTGRRARG